MTLLTGVSGTGSVSIIAPSVGRLYYADALKIDDSIILRLARETDYEKIMGDGSKRGKFINKVRAAGKNPAFMRALDSQTSIVGIERIMNNSAMFNPIKLMQSMKLINRANDFSDLSPGINVAPSYIFDDYTNLYTTKADAVFEIENWKIGIGGHYGNFSASDEFDEFGGNIYGGNLSVRWNGDSLWIHSTAGLGKSVLKDGMIFDGNDATDNAVGTGVYFSVNTGMNFSSDEYYVSPFVGIGAQREEILYQSAGGFYAQTGARAGFATEVMGLRYDYGMFASVATDSVYSAGIKMDIWSVVDGAGAEIEASIMKDEISAVYKFSAKLKFSF
jgi:hypothetical protein